MSKLRITADLIFSDDDSGLAERIFEDLLALADRLETITAAVGRPECSRITLHRCHHDESEPADCEPIDSWESA